MATAGPVESLTHADFEGRIGEPFTVAAPDASTLSLTLAEVSVAGEAPSGHPTPFALEFHDGGAEGYLGQGTFAVEHSELGSFPLFLVPLGPGANGMRYEAVFG